MQLNTNAADFRAFKALIASKYAGVDLTVNVVESSSNVRVPELVTVDGSITESNAIARYIARLRRDSSLYGANFFESAKIDSWVDWSFSEVEVAAVFLVYPVLGALKTSDEVVAKASEDLKSALTFLDAHLLNNTYLVGESITLADIVVASVLVYPFQFIVDAAWRKSIGNVTRWFNTLVNQDEFKSVLGEINLAKENLSAAKGGKKEAKAAAPKEDKPKADKKKEEKKPSKEEEEDEPKPVKKEAHPLTLLPKSKMEMDEWKRTYSNYKSEPFSGVMAKFDELFDASGYTLFKAVYQYPEELITGFMVSNLLNGMLQRCDDVRKFMFGAFHIRKADGDKNFVIDGAILFRGSKDDIKYLLEANDDAQTYNWSPLDYSKDKKFITERWCCDFGDVVDGKTITDVKVFK